MIHYLVGTSCLHLGQFERSIRHLEAALALYDESACRPVAFVAGYHLRSFTLIWSSCRVDLSARCPTPRPLSRPPSPTRVEGLHRRSRWSPRCSRKRASTVTSTTSRARSPRPKKDSPSQPNSTARTTCRVPPTVLRAANAITVDAWRRASSTTRALEAHRATGANFQSKATTCRSSPRRTLASDGSVPRWSSWSNRSAKSSGRANAGGRRKPALARRDAARGRTGHIIAAAPRRASRRRCSARGRSAHAYGSFAPRRRLSLWAAAGHDAEARAVLSPVCAAFADDFAFADLASARATLRRLA